MTEWKAMERNRAKKYFVDGFLFQANAMCTSQRVTGRNQEQAKRRKEKKEERNARRRKEKGQGREKM